MAFNTKSHCNGLINQSIILKRSAYINNSLTHKPAAVSGLLTTLCQSGICENLFKTSVMLIYETEIPIFNDNLIQHKDILPSPSCSLNLS